MKIAFSTDSQDLLVFSKGDNVIPLLLQYCKNQNIQSAWLSGLGAGSYLQYSYYDFVKKEYIKKEIKDDFEINNLTGNIAWLRGTHVPHIHISISNHELKGMGGHLFNLKISGTLELLVNKFDTKLERHFDDETGLNLL